MVGPDEDSAGRDEVAAAFRRCLLSDAETRARGMYWEAVDDGLEAWPGDIHSPLRHNQRKARDEGTQLA